MKTTQSTESIDWLLGLLNGRLASARRTTLLLFKERGVDEKELPLDEPELLVYTFLVQFCGESLTLEQLVQILRFTNRDSHEKLIVRTYHLGLKLGKENFEFDDLLRACLKNEGCHNIVRLLYAELLLIHFAPEILSGKEPLATLAQIGARFYNSMTTPIQKDRLHELGQGIINGVTITEKDLEIIINVGHNGSNLFADDIRLLYYKIDPQTVTLHRLFSLARTYRSYGEKPKSVVMTLAQSLPAEFIDPEIIAEKLKEDTHGLLHQVATLLDDRIHTLTPFEEQTAREKFPLTPAT